MLSVGFAAVAAEIVVELLQCGKRGKCWQEWWLGGLVLVLVLVLHGGVRCRGLGARFRCSFIIMLVVVGPGGEWDVL